MRRNLYILAQCTFLLFITLLVNGCSLHEEPEMTPEGELGVDPTAVTLNLNLAMNLSLAERAPVTITRASETNYLRRFIVEAYLDRQVAARQTVYEEDFNRASLSVSMKLHARNYRILVWADYVNAETPEQGLVYDAENHRDAAGHHMGQGRRVHAVGYRPRAVCRVGGTGSRRARHQERNGGAEQAQGTDGQRPEGHQAADCRAAGRVRRRGQGADRPHRGCPHRAGHAGQGLRAARP